MSVYGAGSAYVPYQNQMMGQDPFMFASQNSINEPAARALSVVSGASRLGDLNKETLAQNDPYNMNFTNTNNTQDGFSGSREFENTLSPFSGNIQGDLFGYATMDRNFWGGDQALASNLNLTNPVARLQSYGGPGEVRDLFTNLNRSVNKYIPNPGQSLQTTPGAMFGPNLGYRSRDSALGSLQDIYTSVLNHYRGLGAFGLGGNYSFGG